MKMIRVALIGSLIATLLAGAVFAHDAAVAGRDVVSAGTEETLTGTLLSEDGVEWSLETEDGAYELHLGPPSFRDTMKIALEQGKEATVYGFVQDRDVSPISVTLDGRRFEFRDESGRPLWAGTGASRGMGWNRDTDRMGEGRGDRMGATQGDRMGGGRGFGSDERKGMGGCDNG